MKNTSQEQGWERIKGAIDIEEDLHEEKLKIRKESIQEKIKSLVGIQFKNPDTVIKWGGIEISNLNISEKIAKALINDNVCKEEDFER